MLPLLAITGAGLGVRATRGKYAIGIRNGFGANTIGGEGLGGGGMEASVAGGGVGVGVLVIVLVGICSV